MDLTRTDPRAMGPRICLAGSGGGHVRQLLDLEPAWRDYEAFFVTERTALGQSLPHGRCVEYVSHYSFGQARLGSPFKMLAGGWCNLRESFAIVRRQRPDIVVTTGAGAMFATALIAKWYGAKLIAIESFARFEGPSLFGRMIRRFADVQIIQSAALAKFYPHALLFDPFKKLDGPRPRKEAVLFATVGATLAFPRLAGAVAQLKRSGSVPHKVILQTGEGGRVDGEDPDDLTQFDTLPFDEVKDLLVKADIVVTHGGTGSLITALREGCHVIAIPRRFALSEHYDDHQEQIVTAFRNRGLLQEVHDSEQLLKAIEATVAREPVMATSDPTKLITWLKSEFAAFSQKKAA